jgi:hypothetical protein
MMKKLMLLSMLAAPVMAAPKPCPRVDPAVMDESGNPMCPSEVVTNTAYSVFRCGVDQARSWAIPTQAEISSTENMLKAFKNRNYKRMRKMADEVGLQVCRVKKEDDQYLLFFAKYGVKDYNGPFMMLRDAAKVSKVWLIAPHQHSDGYFSAAPRGFQDTHAVAYFQAGHDKGGFGAPDRSADFSHSNVALGYHAVKAFGQLYPKSVVLHIHGMKAQGHVLYRPLKGPLAKPFEKAVTKVTKLDDFRGFNAFYEIDPPTVNTGWYVKTELPAVTYRNNNAVVASLIKEWEAQPFAWKDSVLPSPEPEPAGGENSDHE